MVSIELRSKSQIVLSRSKKMCLYCFKPIRMLLTKDNGFIFEHMEVLYVFFGLVAGGVLVYLVFRGRLAGRQQYMNERVSQLEKENLAQEAH